MIEELLLLLFTSAMLCPVAFFWAGCACCGTDCGSITTVCNTGTAPLEFTLVVEGVTGTDSGCNCTAFNQTFVVSYEIIQETGCRYLKTIDICGYHTLWFFIQAPSGWTGVRAGGTFLRVGDDFGFQSADGTFDEEPVDCSTTFSGAILPGDGSTIGCDSTAATMTVT